MSIISENQWESSFPQRNSIYTYENFMKALARYPKFCGEAKDSVEESDLENACKIELAAILTHMK